MTFRRQQSLNYGCVVMSKDSDSDAAAPASSGALMHYVEKPDSYVSTLINCGVYVCSKGIFDLLKKQYQHKQKSPLIEDMGRRTERLTDDDDIYYI